MISLNIKKELHGSNGAMNLDINLSLQNGEFVALSGVSGSGKSSLILQTLLPVAQELLNRARKVKKVDGVEIDGLEKLDKVIYLDQSPIGRTPRSNPATYTGLMDEIRDLFTKTKEASLRGYKIGRFSFNVKGGRCEKCQGEGEIKIEMHFLPDIMVKCDVCNGDRYNAQTLEILYRGKNISEVLNMSVDEALEFFAKVPKLKAKLQTLSDVGLGYITLGQNAVTLSGGEAQRIKLSKELSKKDTGNTLYILDEPSIGLHQRDNNRLLATLKHLRDLGNTLIVVEHDEDTMYAADCIISNDDEFLQVDFCTHYERNGRVVTSASRNFFVEAHLLEDGAGFFIFGRQLLKVLVEVFAHLVFSCGNKAEADLVADQAGDSANAK